MLDYDRTDIFGGIDIWIKPIIYMNAESVISGTCSN